MKKSPKSLPSSKRKGKSLAILAFLAAAVPASQSASAVTVTWDGANGASTSWTDNTAWVGDVLPASGDNVTFSGTTGLATSTVVSLGLPQSVGLLSFAGTTTSFTLGVSGESLTLRNVYRSSTATNTQTIAADVALAINSTWEIAGSGTLSVTGAISGAGTALTKIGAGELRLNGGNTFDGGININAGTLTVGNANALGTTGVISFGGGTLKGFDATDFSSRFSQAANQAYIIDASLSNVTLSSAMTSVGGSLTKVGTGVLTLNAANSYTGATTVTSGTLALGTNGTLGSATAALNMKGGVFDMGGKSVTAGAVNMTAAGTIQNGTLTGSSFYNNTGSNFSITANLAGSGGLTKLGGGTLTLSGSNTYTGDTVIRDGGILKLDFNTATSPLSNIISSSSALTLANTTLTLGGKNGAYVSNSQTFFGTTFSYGNSSLTIGNGAATNSTVLNLGALSRNRGAMVNFSQPTTNVTISASNGYTTTTANDASGILGAYATVGGANWATNSGTNIIAYTGYNTPTGSFPTVATDATTNLRVNNTSSGVVSFATTGMVDVNTLLVNDTAARTIFLNTNDTLRFGAVGGILTPASTGALTIGYLDDGETMTAGGADNTAGELIINNATAISVNPTIANNGTGAVTLTKAGAGTLTLNAASTHSGGTFVNGGTLAFGITGTTNLLSTTGDITVNGGTLNFGANGQTTSGAVVINGGTVSSGTLTKTGSNFDVRAGTISTILAGSVGLNKTTTGSLTLSGANTYTGPTRILEGAVTLPASAATKSNYYVGSPDGSTSATFNAATSSNINAKDVTVYTNSKFTLGNGVHANTLYIVGGVVESVYGYVDSGYNMTGGTMYGPVYGNAATWVTNASSSTANILNVSASFSQKFTVADGPAAVDARLTPSFTGSLTKNGSGLLSLEGSNMYSGATAVNGGTLRLNFSATSAPVANITGTASAVTLVNSVLELVGKDSTANAQRFGNVAASFGYNQISAIAGSGGGSMAVDFGALSRGASGVLNFVNPAGTSFTTYAATTSTNGVLVSAATNGIAYMTINQNDWATVSGSSIIALSSYDVDDFSSSSKNVDLTSDQSPAAFTVSTLRFNTANTTLTLTGANQVSTGGLLVGSNGTGVTITSGTIAGGGGNELVVINNGSLNIASTIAGANKSLTLAGTGTTTLSGNNSYKDTNLDSGTLIVTNVNSLGTTGNLNLSGGTLASESALSISRPVYLTGDVTIGGSNALTFSNIFSGGNNPPASRILTVNNTELTKMTGITNLSASGGSTTLVVNGTGTLELAGVVNGIYNNTGGSSLTYSGVGNLILSGSANTYSGATTILSGTVSVASLKNEATVGSSTTVSGSNTITLSATALSDILAAGVGVGSGITGTGIPASTTIAAIDGNIVTLSQNATAAGTNNLTYGPTNVSSIGQSTTAATNLVIDGGTLKYIGATGTTNRAFTVGASGATLDASGSGAINFTNSGMIGLSNVTGARTLNLAGTNTDANTLAAVIADSAFDPTHVTKNGVGTWVLTGTSTYTGNTTITGGTLSIGAVASIGGSKKIDVRTGGTLDLSAQSAFTLGSSQTLQSTGVGTVTGPAGVLSANGTVAPGGVATTGTLNVIGSLTLAGTTLIDLNNAGGTLTWDMLTATTLTLGGVVTFNVTGDAFVGGEVFTVLGASNWSGNFSSINLPALASGLTWDYSTLGVDGRLLVVPEPATWAFMVGGLGMLAFMKRARRNRL